MRTPTEIQKQIEVLIEIKNNAEVKYKKLHQIDIQSEEGVELREMIDKTNGQINALKWVLNLK